MTASIHACVHCGSALDPAHEPIGPGNELDAPSRYDLEALAVMATAEEAYDETVKVRVTQEDIRKLVAKRHKKRK